MQIQTKIEVKKEVFIKERGAAVQTTTADNQHASASGKTRYSYVELSDGTLLKGLEIADFLDEKLDQAVKDNLPLELHIGQVRAGKKTEVAILALRILPEGRLFAADVPEMPFIRTLVIACYAIGVITLPFMGFGLLGIYYGYKMQKAGSAIATMRKYVRGLHGAILLGDSRIG